MASLEKETHLQNPQFLGSMLIFGGVMTYTDLHESASIRQKFLQFSLRDFWVATSG